MHPDRITVPAAGDGAIQLSEDAEETDGPIAVVDIGSNSIRLAIIETDGHDFLDVIEEARAVPKLIRDVNAHGSLSDESIETVLDVLRDFMAIARGSRAREVYAVATSAVRDASNGSDLVARAASELGMLVEIAPGTQEAEYAFTGAVHGLPTDRGIVIDIGGGSMEVVRFAGRELIGAWTLPLGAVRLADDFTLSDPPRPKQLDVLRAHVERVWSEAGIAPIAPGEQFVGTGGTVRNLAKVDRAGRRYPLPRLHGYGLPVDRLEAVADELARRETHDRADLTGLNPDRADTIVVGATVVLSVLRIVGASELLVSGQGLREGIALAHGGHGHASIDEVREAAVRRLLHRFGASFEAVRARASVLDALMGTLQPTLSADVEAALREAVALLDVGRVVDYYTRHRQTEAILVAHGIAGFSHREVALICALVRQAGNERFSTLSYEPLVIPSDVASLSEASTILAACDEVALRVPPGASLISVANESAVTLAVRDSHGSRNLSVLGGRFARAFGVPLVLAGV